MNTRTACQPSSYMYTRSQGYSKLVWLLYLAYVCVWEGGGGGGRE